MTKELFEKICQKYDLIGANLYIVNDQEITTFQAGYQNKELMIPTSTKSIYRIASISKTVLAIAAMKLVEDKLLNLDEDISTYLGFSVRNPNFPDDIITLRMLMTQTSSITDGFDDEDMTNVERVDGYNGINGKYLNLPLKTLLVPNDSIYYSDLTFDKHRPGSTFIYSNFGCGIMACIIEKASGMNYDEYAKKVIFDPLKIDASYYAYNIKDQESIATLYSKYGQRDRFDFYKKAYPKAPLGESYLGPAGGLFISIENLAKIMQSFWVKEYQLLKDETIEQMLTINWEGDAAEYQKKALQMIVLDGYAPFRVFGHFGTAYGLRSMMLFNKDLHKGVCFITNGGNTQERIHYIPAVHYEMLKGVWNDENN